MKRPTVFSLAGALGALALTFAAAGCSKGDSTSDNSGGSAGGSMARFAISGDWLYTVNDSDLTVVSIANAAHPAKGDKYYLEAGIETIFPMDTLLFVGSQFGMYIYDIKKPEFPRHLSTTTHFRSCDPVVAHDSLAFVTLNASSGSWCGTRGDVLQIYDIRNLESPDLLVEMRLTSPRGLAVDGEQKMLFVCDSGIKAIDITNPKKPEILYSALSNPEVGRIDAYDCMVWDGRLLVVGSDGLYQLGYDREKFTLISKIDLRTE